MRDIYLQMRDVVIIATMRALIQIQRERLQQLTERLREYAP